jgi:hypothetical protein
MKSCAISPTIMLGQFSFPDSYRCNCIAHYPFTKDPPQKTSCDHCIFIGYLYAVQARPHYRYETRLTISVRGTLPCTGCGTSVIYAGQSLTTGQDASCTGMQSALCRSNGNLELGLICCINNMCISMVFLERTPRHNSLTAQPSEVSLILHSETTLQVYLFIYTLSHRSILLSLRIYGYRLDFLEASVLPVSCLLYQVSIGH